MKRTSVYPVTVISFLIFRKVVMLLVFLKFHGVLGLLPNTSHPFFLPF